MKFIDDRLHLLSVTGIYQLSQDLKQVSQICQISDFFAEQQIVTCFSGSVEANAFAFSALVGGRPKTFLFNQKQTVIPDMLISQITHLNGQLFLTTSAAAGMKITTVNLTQLKPAKAEIPQEANEIVKIIVPLSKYGLLALFTSIMKVYILDLFTMKVLTELRSSTQVAMAAQSQAGITYIQTDGRIYQLIPEMQLLVSTLQNKLSALEQYNHFIQTKLLSGHVQFNKIYKNYMEECFKAQDYVSVAKIVADSVTFQADDVRTQQLIDKINLSDRKAFLLFSSALV